MFRQSQNLFFEWIVHDSLEYYKYRTGTSRFVLGAGVVTKISCRESFCVGH